MVQRLISSNWLWRLVVTSTSVAFRGSPVEGWIVLGMHCLCVIRLQKSRFTTQFYKSQDSYVLRGCIFVDLLIFGVVFQLLLPSIHIQLTYCYALYRSFSFCWQETMVGHKKVKQEGRRRTIARNARVGLGCIKPANSIYAVHGDHHFVLSS